MADWFIWRVSPMLGWSAALVNVEPFPGKPWPQQFMLRPRLFIQEIGVDGREER
ncbi:hypothetical protein [Streptomyces lunaelactis]|uniref:hypothetical protein n=1 Tax=Streptomyces lunaelactis TaxID=1535768 RepID=UPI0015858FEF|nr:hypothetical protein [Streptomyces lunaelactis]NUK00909.1 hypothetical protein [Streptomyces lunaelactis]